MSPYAAHPWWLAAVLVSVAVLVAWIAGGQAFLEHRYADEFDPGTSSPD